MSEGTAIQRIFETAKNLSWPAQLLPPPARPKREEHEAIGPLPEPPQPQSSERAAPPAAEGEDTKEP